MTYKSNLITIYEGDGAGSWMQAATLPIPETTGYVLKVADLDHNGYSDIVYWANPGTRRHLDERQSTPTIGFRCAMTRVGSPKGLGDDKRREKLDK